MTFGITPAGGFPPAAAEDFPNFIQFQADGTDLGGPDADTVNFSTGLTATRGTGENANVITVEADGGGGGVETYVANFTGAEEQFDGERSVPELANLLVDHADVSWNEVDSVLEIAGNGIWELVFMAEIVPTEGIGDGYIEYGIYLAEVPGGGIGEVVSPTPSRNSRNLTSETGHGNIRFTDTHVVATASGEDPAQFDFGVYGSGDNEFGFTPVLTLIARRLGDWNVG
jgi:hypothetical protein